MNSNDISSNISPLEMAEMNNEDAKKIDVALGVIMNDMPSTIATIKSLLDEVETKINSLQTRDLKFYINKEEMENLTKAYDTFVQDVINFASYYELIIVNIINIFDRMNSLDGTPTVDNNFFKNLPFLGTILFTLLTYDRKELLTQLILDMTGNVMDKDFNESLGNLAYNTTELALDHYITTHITAQNIQSSRFFISNGVAAGGLILVESLYGILYKNTDHRQDNITMINSIGDGVKLVAGNVIAQSVALPVAIAIGGPVGVVIGGGTIVLSEIGLDYCIDQVCAELSGEAFIPGTSIPKNGGTMSLYSDYVKAIDTNNYNLIGRTTSLNGMTVSAEYCREMAQLDPVATLSELDDFSYTEGSTWARTLDSYLADLKAISPNSSNFNEQVDSITSNALAGYYDGGMSSEYIRFLVIDLGFDPYTYAIDN